METIEFYLHTDNVLNSNKDAGSHWGKTHGPKTVVRQMGAAHSRRFKTQFQRLHVRVLASYPDNIQRDAMNLYPTMKAYVDGLVNGIPEYTVKQDKHGRMRKRRKAPDRKFGVLPDDNDRYLVGPHIEWSGRLSHKKDHYLFQVILVPLPPLQVEPAAEAKWNQ